MIPKISLCPAYTACPTVEIDDYEVHMPLTLEDAYARVAACLNPVLEGTTSGQCDPSRGVWDER